MSRPRLKTVTLTVRIEPATKEALAAMATAERRSLANMLETVVMDRYNGRPAGAPRSRRQTTKR